ncbi:hypothetical protein I3271_09260 [Photobacterium leiognathi]|uniref:hypothetical protein n=1 Tax=Photobacterium leiognathi TaxID=553611 RepID=UPI001EE016D1|nr:hypothetical protein [Photobacterium leiognathi]MCG3884876.1 hypothetical protein [Photobacterium leiognathi]
MSHATKSGTVKRTEELISIKTWQTESLFTFRVKRLNCMADFLEMITNKHGKDCSLSFEDWHIEEETFIDNQVQEIADKLIVESDSNCPELIDPKSDRKALVVILPEPYPSQRDKGNMFRLGYYNETGSSYHENYRIFKEAVYKALISGYNVLEVGALDKLVDTRLWNRGIVVSKAAQKGVWLNEYLEKFATNEELQLFGLPKAS